MVNKAIVAQIPFFSLCPTAFGIQSFYHFACMWWMPLQLMHNIFCLPHLCWDGLVLCAAPLDVIQLKCSCMYFCRMDLKQLTCKFVHSVLVCSCARFFLTSIRSFPRIIGIRSPQVSFVFPSDDNPLVWVLIKSQKACKLARLLARLQASLVGLAYVLTPICVAGQTKPFCQQSNQLSVDSSVL